MTYMYLNYLHFTAKIMTNFNKMVKVKLSLCPIMQYAMETYGEWRYRSTFS
jgi:hypothetical protein